MAETDKNEEAKVMDVAKPGEAKPDTGAKPMVIGHRTMATDPTIKEPEEEKSKESSEPAQIKKIRLEPISDQKDEVVDTGENEAEKEKSVAETVKKAETPSESKEPQPSEPPAEPEQTEEQKKQSEDDAKLEQEARLEEIIKSKEFVVPIKESSTTSFKAFIVSFSIVLLLGLLVGVILIDADIVDLDIELPFDFL